MSFLKLFKRAERFILFSIVGAIGLVADVATLEGLLAAGASPYVGQVAAYLVAATVTWGLNRKYTFRGSGHRGARRQWATYLGVNALGGLVNYGVYVASLRLSPAVYHHPYLGVALGSLAGLTMNFLMSQRLVFR